MEPYEPGGQVVWFLLSNVIGRFREGSAMAYLIFLKNISCEIFTGE